jgi:hypothetical protein
MRGMSAHPAPQTHITQAKLPRFGGVFFFGAAVWPFRETDGATLKQTGGKGVARGMRRN